MTAQLTKLGEANEEATRQECADTRAEVARLVEEQKRDVLEGLTSARENYARTLDSETAKLLKTIENHKWTANQQVLDLHQMARDVWESSRATDGI